MGMHIGLVAAKTSVARFRDAFSSAWPQFEIVASKDDLPDPNAMWAWKDSHEKFVSAADWTKDNPGQEVYCFWQDGPWAVMVDSSYTLASDEEALKALSFKIGTVLSFVVETAGGCAFFACYENGKLRRQINNNDGDVSAEGEPLPEEVGIDVNSYYMDETEAFWKAFGFSRYEEMPTSQGCQAICVIDHTDYGEP
jgi:hypothetical protein